MADEFDNFLNDDESIPEIDSWTDEEEDDNVVIGKHGAHVIEDYDSWEDEDEEDLVEDQDEALEKIKSTPSLGRHARIEDMKDDDEEENEEELEEEEPRYVSEEMRVAAMTDNMPKAHGEVVKDANGGSGTTVISSYLGKEMQASFLEYSMSVIVSRALPDVRDGLKPVHRRILYAMDVAGFNSTKPHMKSARTVGDVIGKYHPHGDVAVYDTMVRLAQPFSLRVPLVDGHGNFGSIDGDSAAAMRYTEARLSKAGESLLEDWKKETVDMMPNYDETLAEPTVLPASFPNLLVNGSNGIAVGMATNIPPHNLGESIDAACLMIDNPDVTTEELMKVMPGPDFPTGGIITGRQGIIDAYETGRGSLTIRAKHEVVEAKNGRKSIVIKEVPYQVNRKRLLEKLGELVRDKKLSEISNIHDAADRKGIDIIIDLKASAIPEVVVNKLFKHTQLQVGFGVIMLALVDGVPRVLSLKETLHYYIKHREDVVTRRTKHDLEEAQAREHVLEGLIVALDNIDEVISIIRSSQTDAEAAKRMSERFGLSDKQTHAILEMKLRRLTGLERDKIEEELASLREQIAYFKSILSDINVLHKVIKEEMLEVKRRFATPRKTKIVGEAKEINAEDLIADEKMVVTVTRAGYIKRLPVATYKQQRRGGKGMQGTNLKDNDFVEHLFVASTHEYMLFFSSTGKVYRLKVYDIPEGSRHARGTHLANLLQLEKTENVSAIISSKHFPENEYLMFATSQGMVKKTSMKLYDRTRRDGLIAISLKEGDELISVKRVSAGESVMMVSSAGKAIRWDEKEARPMGRDTMGVKGMELPNGAKVIGMEIATTGSRLLVITEHGDGKRTQVEKYPLQHRGGQGVSTFKMTEKKGRLAAMKVVQVDDEIMLITESGIVIRTSVKGITEQGRDTTGVKIMDVGAKDRVAAIAIADDDEDKVALRRKQKKAQQQEALELEDLEGESEEEFGEDFEEDDDEEQEVLDGDYADEDF